MRMQFVFAFGMVAATFLATPFLRGQKLKTNVESGTVRILAVDTLGHSIVHPKVKRFEDTGGLDFSDKFRDGIANGIPFGNYRVDVAPPPGSYLVTGSRAVSVYQAQTVVVVGLNVGQIADYAPPPRLRGRVVGDLSAVLFIKAIGIFTGYVEEAEIGKNGEFEIPDLGPGINLIMVVSEDAILASRIVSVPRDTLPKIVDGNYVDPVLEIPIEPKPQFGWR